MKPKEKLEYFKEEISFIENEEMKKIAENLIALLPDYFFTVAASSTGKYHPDFAQGEGGLLRHTKAAVRIAMELLRLEMNMYLLPAKDYIVLALILHDGWKHGPQRPDGTYNQYTIFTHPIIAADKVRGSNASTKDVLEYLASLIETHMGEWTFNYRTGGNELPKPLRPEQCFVHVCDYLASRKCLEFNENVKYEE